MSSKETQNGDSQEHLSLSEEISRIKHLVNSEERPIDENLKTVTGHKRCKLTKNWKRNKARASRKRNKTYKAGPNMKVNNKNNNNEGTNRKRPIFVNSFLKKTISSIVAKSRNKKKRISSRNVCTEKRNFIGSSEASSNPMMNTVVTMMPCPSNLPHVKPSLSAPLIQLPDNMMIIDQSSAQTALSGSTSVIYVVNNYHHYHHHYYLHPQLQDSADEGSLCFIDVTDSSMKSNAVQDIP